MLSPLSKQAWNGERLKYSSKKTANRLFTVACRSAPAVVQQTELSAQCYLSHSHGTHCCPVLFTNSILYLIFTPKAIFATYYFYFKIDTLWWKPKLKMLFKSAFVFEKHRLIYINVLVVFIFLSDYTTASITTIMLMAFEHMRTRKWTYSTKTLLKTTSGTFIISTFFFLLNKGQTVYQL